MVRKDGFLRIAQDLRQEGLNAFPADYLDDEMEVGQYSDYVTEAVSDYESSTDSDNNLNPTNAYEDNPPSLTSPADAIEPLLVPGRSIAEHAEMAPDGVSEQQLRARGIYIDYMTDELRKKINCLDLDGDGESCDVPEVTSALEIIPFYDVQLTWLARWNETPNNNPVDVMNEAIADDNTHKRGIAKLTTGSGFSTTNSTIHSRNLGLTGTDPIDLQYGPQTRRYDLWVREWMTVRSLRCPASPWLARLPPPCPASRPRISISRQTGPVRSHADRFRVRQSVRRQDPLDCGLQLLQAGQDTARV